MILYLCFRAVLRISTFWRLGRAMGEKRHVALCIASSCGAGRYCATARADGSGTEGLADLVCLDYRHSDAWVPCFQVCELQSFHFIDENNIIFICTTIIITIIYTYVCYMYLWLIALEQKTWPSFALVFWSSQNISTSHAWSNLSPDQFSVHNLWGKASG